MLIHLENKSNPVLLECFDERSGESIVCCAVK